ncbi:hypothetical protein EDD18DRAFT_677007 [Armillaria luteobubalina]|uniref:Uncharacterized protein n=1 Tax=Armillaria luteobubalina TaxID=153913 RepID=A0AA39QFF5_9AGAR|nr:hypothetical protein EDD18DRAFT_677007 [Armillaria luteobubalina]
MSSISNYFSEKMSRDCIMPCEKSRYSLARVSFKVDPERPCKQGDVQVEIMGGFPVVFIGYELEDDALDIYRSSNCHREAVKSLLHVVESETSRPASIVRYDDSKGQTHQFVCCFVDLSGRTYSPKEIDAIPVPSEFFGVPKRVKTRGELERKFSPSAMVNSYGADGKTRVDAGAVIGELPASFP